MNIADYVLLLLIFVGIVLAVTAIYKQKKSGKCIGCSGCSGSCASCNKDCKIINKNTMKSNSFDKKNE